MSLKSTILGLDKWFSNKNNPFHFASEIGHGAASLLKGADITGSQAQQNEYDYNLALQQQAQAFNSAEAEKDRRFQMEMSNSAYSRAFKDLENAGYNPYIALTSGAAASTPGGASASSSAGQVSRQNNRSYDLLSKAVEGAIKAGQSSASSVGSIAKIIAFAMLA